MYCCVYSKFCAIRLLDHTVDLHRTLGRRLKFGKLSILLRASDNAQRITRIVSGGTQNCRFRFLQARTIAEADIFFTEWQNRYARA